jgi:hypothetical protein
MIYNVWVAFIKGILGVLLVCFLIDHPLIMSRYLLVTAFVFVIMMMFTTASLILTYVDRRDV